MKTAPAVVWNYYPHLVEVEQAFRNLKGDLAIRPIFHQDEARMEAHIFVSVLEKFAAIQMVDVQIPTSDGRTLLLPRYTHPEAELRLLLERLKRELPAQPPPRITVAPGQTEAAM